jgi:hypothetical protein
MPGRFLTVSARLREAVEELFSGLEYTLEEREDGSIRVEVEVPIPDYHDFAKSPDWMSVAVVYHCYVFRDRDQKVQHGKG